MTHLLSYNLGHCAMVWDLTIGMNKLNPRKNLTRPNNCAVSSFDSFSTVYALEGVGETAVGRMHLSTVLLHIEIKFRPHACLISVVERYLSAIITLQWHQKCSHYLKSQSWLYDDPLS